MIELYFCSTCGSLLSPNRGKECDNCGNELEHKDDMIIGRFKDDDGQQMLIAWCHIEN